MEEVADAEVVGGRPTEEGGDIIAGTTTTMDTDAATITAGTPRGEGGEGGEEEGALASSGRRSRACVNFGHRRGRRHQSLSTSAIVAAVD